MMQTSSSIVITGAGVVTSLGLDSASTWAGVLGASCGIGPSNSLEQTPKPDKGTGDAPPLPPDYMPALPREVRYLRWAIDAALCEAKLADPQAKWPYAPDRCGIVLGTTLHGMRAVGRFLRDDNPDSLRTFLAGSTCDLATRGLPLHGYATTTCAACASGLVSISLAMTLLQSRKLDMLVAGGYDPVSEYAYGGFNSLRLLAEGPQTPFASNRTGLKLAEGYGIVVLERHEEAVARGVVPRAAILQCTGSADAHHLSQPHPEGAGAALAMNAALQSAGLLPRDIGLIVAHATATPDNDKAEYLAMQRVFGSALPAIPVTALKSHLGHTLGGAGAVELVVALEAMRLRVAPPLANVSADDVEFPGLRVVTSKPVAMTSGRVMINSLGFGGSNACLVLGEADSEAMPLLPHTREPDAVASDARSGDDVVITGIGVVVPGAVGNQPFVELLGRGRAPVLEDTGAVDDEQLIAQLSSRRVRRMSEYVKLSLAATAIACRDAGIETPLDGSRRWAAISGTTHGSARFSYDYYKQIIDEGLDSANPLLFAEGVPNAGSAHLSMMLNIKGPCQTLIGSRTVGLDAVQLAAARIAAGEVDAVVVGAAEEYYPLINQVYAHCCLYAGREAGLPFGGGGFASGAGAVSLILERRSAAEARGARPWASVGLGAQAAWDPDAPDAASPRIASALTRCGQTTSILCSANGTWLDQVEMLAMASHAASPYSGQPVRGGLAVSSISGHVSECFAATPLVGLAAVLLTGRLPRLYLRCPWDASLAPARGEEDVSAWTAMCSDYNGVTTVLTCRNELERQRTEHFQGQRATV